MLVNVPRLVTAYYAEHPDGGVAAERVAFGTSGHRGSAFERTFNEAHILAITQAICSYRQAHNVDGPLFMGMDTHALSEPAFHTAVSVFSAHGLAAVLTAQLFSPCRLSVMLWRNGKRSAPTSTTTWKSTA